MVYFNFQALCSKSIFLFQFKLLPVKHLEFIFNDKKQVPSFTSKIYSFHFRLNYNFRTISLRYCFLICVSKFGRYRLLLHDFIHHHNSYIEFETCISNDRFDPIIPYIPFTYSFPIRDIFRLESITFYIQSLIYSIWSHS